MQRHDNGYNYHTFLSKNLFFFHKSSKKQEKEAGTNFILLSHSKKKNDWMIHENFFT